MDPFHVDDGTASISDEEEKNIFLRLAKEFEIEEDYLLPIITPPVNSPPIEFFDLDMDLDCLEDLQESEMTIKQPTIGEEPIVRDNGGPATQTMTVTDYGEGGGASMSSFQDSWFPVGFDGEGSSQGPIGENMNEQAFNNRYQCMDGNKNDAATCKWFSRRIRNKESAARSRSRKRAHDLQVQLEINNLRKENQFENKVLAFLSNQNIRTGGRRNGLRRTISASS